MSIASLPLDLLFPPKCILCRKVLDRTETDLCRDCRMNMPVFDHPKKSISFVAHWTAVWYYKGNVRESILRYKFRNNRSYAAAYARLLAMRLQNEEMQFDVLTWVPVSFQRRLHRGYDQVELIARGVGAELGVEPVRCLKKVRNVKPQSHLQGESRRKANILGAYRPVHPENFTGKRVLILDDIITTGATVSECASTLSIGGAKEVICGAVAAAEKHECR